MTYQRGAVVKGPDFFGPHPSRPFVCLSTPATHPFSGEEGIYVAVTKTPRPNAIPLPASSFTSGGLPKQSFASPWVVTTLKDADIMDVEGQLDDSTTEQIAKAAAGYMGVQQSP